MSFKYKNMQRFVRCTIHPFIINVRDSCYSKVDLAIKEFGNTLDTQLANFQKQIDSMNTKLTTHENRRDNPHVVTISQLATITYYDPTGGSEGACHIQLLN